MILLHINEKVSSIIKESLKSSEIENYKLENSLSVPLKVARENFEKDDLFEINKLYQNSLLEKKEKK